MKIRQAHLDALSDHGKRGYPYEVCGVLLGRAGAGRVDRVVPMKNRETEQPRIRYQIAPEDLLQLYRESAKEGLDVVGYYHTHPDHPPRPSPTDLARAVETGGLGDGMLHIVMAVEKGERTSAPCGWLFRFDGQRFDEEPFDIEP
jgi:proteasome lid subunit RPN8/RPN11